MGKSVKRYAKSFYDDDKEDKRNKSSHYKHSTASIISNVDEYDFDDDQTELALELEYHLRRNNRRL